MKFESIRGRLLASTMIGGAVAAMALPAFAQQAATPSGSDASTVKEIVVTGSRIPRANLTSVSPITAVTSQEAKLEGTVDVVDLLDQLPQAAVGLNNTPNPLNSGLGYTTADLRNLGAERTLVLIDGKRMGAGDPTLGGDVPDLDTIPTQLIDRVDVVTGGASAVYGSDAIAGVVNFVLKKNFTGIQIDAQYGMDESNNSSSGMQSLANNAFGKGTAPSGAVLDGATDTITITMGANSADGKGNLTGYMTYENQEPVKMNSRDYSSCMLYSINGKEQCLGSENSNLFVDTSAGGKSYAVSGVAGKNQFIPWTGTNAGVSPGEIYNSNPDEYLSRQDTRYMGGFLGHYDLDDHFQFYTEFSYMHDQTIEAVAPGGSFDDVPLSINCANPYLSAQQLSTMVNCTNGASTVTANGTPASESYLIGRRDIEGGPREAEYTHDTFRDVIGVKGNIDDAGVWTYDLSGVYSQTNYTQEESGYFSSTNLQNALDVVNVNGVPTCAVKVTNASSTCVPYNIFSQGGVTKQALAYLEVPSVFTGSTTEQNVNLDFVGRLGQYGIKSPWATEGVGVSFGAQYRRDTLSENPDEENASGDLDGGSGVIPPVSGTIQDKEWYAEARLPIIQDHPFAKDLTIELGYRISDYSTSGEVDAWKYGGEWAPNSQVRFRGSFERAVRAPNVNELFYPDELTNQSAQGTDPCAGTSPTATLQQCERTGVTAAEYGHITQCPAGQCGGSIGGNTALKPETSDTQTFGAVFTPTFIRNFNFSIDYFNIDVMNEVSYVPENVTFDECLNYGKECNDVVRTSTGELFGQNLSGGGYITATNQNVGFMQTSGLDFAANYRMSLEQLGLKDKGSLDFSFNGTWTQNFIYEPVVGMGSYNCAGYFGAICAANGNPVPTWRHKLRVTWNTPWNVQISGQWRFISGMTQDIYSSNPILNGVANGSYLNTEGYDPEQKSIAAYNYFDLSAVWKVKDGLVLRAGVNNIFDKDPPILSASVSGTGSPNTYPMYDLLGRQLFVGLTANF